MKKFLLLMLTLICTISLVACMGGDDSTSESKKENQSKKESVSISQSIKDSVSASEPASELESESVSEPASEHESESVSEPASESASESVAKTFTITFEVEGAPAPDPMVVEEGEAFTLPTVEGEYQLKHWVIKGTNTVFDVSMLDSDVTLVAVFYNETDLH